MSTFYSDGVGGTFIRPASNPTTSVDAVDNPGNAIDTNTSTFAHVNGDSDLDAGTPADYTFANPLENAGISALQPVRVTGVRFKKDRSDEGTVTVGNQVIEWSNSVAFDYVMVDINPTIFIGPGVVNTAAIPYPRLDELVITLNTQSGGALIQSKLYDVRIYVEVLSALSGDAVYKRYEFNDSVLTTKAWNSSRYDGRQLQFRK